jgi:hypothetical protein
MNRLPDFKERARLERERLGASGLDRLLDDGRAWDLAATVSSGGAVVFPHLGLEACGAMAAAAVHAALDSGASRALVIGVLHALTRELDEARRRVADGGDPSHEDSWGIQGPGVAGRSDWRREFSLDAFLCLWERELERRGIAGPELVLRYPYLAGGRPGALPGIGELEELADGAAVLATADPFHHGVGYGDDPEDALPADERGLAAARASVEGGLAILARGDHAAYNRHCVDAKSDARDVGQVLRHLTGPVEGVIRSIAAADMTEAYGAEPPTWVAGALIELKPAV